MSPFRMLAGIGVFLASAWVSLYVSDVLMIDDGIAFLSVGEIMSFFGGILFHSGVKACTCSYRS